MQIYKDLCTELEIAEARVQDLERHLMRLKKKLFSGPREIQAYDPSKPPGSSAHQPFDKQWREYVECTAQLVLATSRRDELRKLKNEVDGRISELEGLDQRVVIMRDVERMTLGEIAESLNYSEVWIKKISSRNPKKR